MPKTLTLTLCTMRWDKVQKPCPLVRWTQGYHKPQIIKIMDINSTDMKGPTVFPFAPSNLKPWLTTWWKFWCFKSMWDCWEVFVDLFKVHMKSIIFYRDWLFCIWWYLCSLGFFNGFHILALSGWRWTPAIFHLYWFWGQRMLQREWFSRCNCQNLKSGRRYTVKTTVNNFHQKGILYLIAINFKQSWIL